MQKYLGQDVNMLQGNIPRQLLTENLLTDKLKQQTAHDLIMLGIWVFSVRFTKFKVLHWDFVC